jgi:hypothetical protein
MPTAAALAAATITAQLQAKDIETNSQATVVRKFFRKLKTSDVSIVFRLLHK